MVASITISKALDEVFAFVVARQGLVSNDDLAGIEERPLAPFLVEHEVITAEQADDVFSAIGKSVLACPCGAVYTGMAAADGKKYSCRKCKASIAYPTAVTIEARSTRLTSLLSEASPTPTAPSGTAKERPPSSPKLEPVAAKPASQPKLPAVAAKWFFSVERKKSGPHETRESIAALVDAGKLDHETLAWRKGLQEWQPAGQVAELASFLEDVPPPIPAAAAPAPAPAPAAKAEAKPEAKPEAKAGARPAEPAPAPAAAPVDDAAYAQGKLAAILSYWIWPLAFFLKGQNPFARYHAGQGFIYFVFAVVVWAAVVCLQIFTTTIASVLTFLPAVVWRFWGLAWMIVSLVMTVAFLCISIKGTLNVLHRKQEPLPILNRVPLLGRIVRRIGNPA